MRIIPIPAALHDVFGAQQSSGSIVLVVAAGLSMPLALVAADPASFSGVDLWRAVLAAVLIADVAAGAVANLTDGTNDHYAVRPRSRWLFIAVHVHLPVVALLLDAPTGSALILWAGTIGGAVIVNVLAGRRTQRPAAGAALSAVLVAIPLLPTTPTLAATAAVFALKVVLAFAVDHRATQRTLP